ncbi:hypothetical protein K1719_032766 [Acacia pycnantha]|nr:hypothetical protein K1719_032766 [Acacia pycnantha]
MEGLKKQWKEQQEAEVDEQGPENSETGDDSSDVEKNKTSASFDPIVSGDSNSLNNVKNESERVGLITENVQLVREAYLESLYQKAPSEGFYCPNCKTCIQKVLILDTVREETNEEIQENTTIQEGEVQEAGSNKRLEILKSIVYGGLIESIARLVPPLMYGLTFSMSNNNKDVTMAVVAGASALCITLLSIAKAYIQKPNNNTYFTYLQTVVYYLYIALVGDVLSHFYGGLVKGFLEKHDWFGSQSSSFSLIVPDMSTDQKLRFGSY